nr:hypothetical protein [Treponema sp.]
MNEIEFEKIIAFITEKIGIIPRESHKFGISKFVEKKIATLGFGNYFMKIQTEKEEFDELVNGSTVNETYFFREEKQFELLRSKIFPEWINRHGAEPMRIWSAACSEGEEAYSLALLASHCRVKPLILASDINTAVLEKCRNGVFKPSTVRAGDGEKFKHLLQRYTNPQGEIVFDDSVKSAVSTKKINLTRIGGDDVKIEKQNVIFVRNVFIYFSRKTRAEILKALAEKYLADGGLIFVSMNEIAQIDSEMTPASLTKIADGNVFYFMKTN